MEYVIDTRTDGLGDFLDDYELGRDFTLEPIRHREYRSIEGIMAARARAGLGFSRALGDALRTCAQWDEDLCRIVWIDVVGAVAFKLRFGDELA